MNVLIVDDTQTIALLLKIYIANWGIPANVLHAVNGLQALELARQTKPDIIISDVRMPEMDGFELCTAMRSDETLRRVPFFLLTSLSDDASRQKGKEVGATEFLRKPITPENLREVVGPFLNLRPGK